MIEGKKRFEVILRNHHQHRPKTAIEQYFLEKSQQIGALINGVETGASQRYLAKQQATLDALRADPYANPNDIQTWESSVQSAQDRITLGEEFSKKHPMKKPS